MSLQNHYLQTAAQLLTNYDGSIPLHLYLKQFFREHKKYGSRDRKQIAGLCYHFFRMGKAGKDLPVPERIILALFLASQEESPLLAAVNPEFNKLVSYPVDEKWKIAGLLYSTNDIFPFEHSLSGNLDAAGFAASFLIQPDVFIRVRPGKKQLVQQKLDQLNWTYHLEGSAAIRLNPGLAVDQHFKMNSELVIQDLNSQRVGDHLKTTFENFNFQPTQLWDCCAASGGKSIMLYDLYPGLKILASDIRESILHNLTKRFREAGIEKYQSFVADLSVKSQKLKVKEQQFIIADVPCTGSGTWARTPEQLYFFKEKMLDDYAVKQYEIANNALNYLLPGGWLVYITCSAFYKENEAVVSKLLNNNVELINQVVLEGTNQKCDTMFVAIIRKKPA
ncbi:MAG: Fmu (Sun) domain-containing protein [Bacteroidota bacterium]